MSGSEGVAPCKHIQSSRLQWRPCQSRASSQVPSLASGTGTYPATRRQGARRPERQCRGYRAPQENRCAVAAPPSPAGTAASQPPRGRGWGEAAGVRTHGMRATEGRGTRERPRVPARLDGSDTLPKRGGPDPLWAVRLAESTRRWGEPLTGGSGQQALPRARGTCAPGKGRSRASSQREEHPRQVNGTRKERSASSASPPAPFASSGPS